MINYSLKLVIVGTTSIAVGVVIGLGIWFPGLRGYHKFTGIRMDILSTASAALLPSSWGIIVVWLGLHPTIQDVPVIWFAVSFALAMIGVVIGLGQDRRSNRQP